MTNQPTAVPTHPVQKSGDGWGRQPSRCPQVVTLRAYEVYKHMYGPQEAMITDSCRGGFSAGELIAFLYAFSFPKNEWRERVNEALIGMEHL